MAKQRQLHIPFPLGGLDRRGAYRQQRPYTTPDCRNVRPFGTLEGRERGGSRPGLVVSHVDDLGAEVRFLEPMTLALGDGFTAWSDTFSGLSMADAWSLAPWAESLPSILPSSLASIDTSVADAAAVLDALPIETAVGYPYVVEVFLVPWDGAWHGTYRIYLHLDDTTPDIETDVDIIELTMTGTSGEYLATMTARREGDEWEVDSATGTLGAAIPGWLTVTVARDPFGEGFDDDMTVYWGGTEIMYGEVEVIEADDGTRVGFGLECTVDGGLCLANTFRVQYYSTESIDALRTKLIASSGGDIYQESTYGRMTVVTSDLTVRDDVPLMAAQSGQKLYIADYGDLRDTGTDGTVTGAELDDAGGQDWTTLGIDPDSDVCVISNVGGATVAGTYKIDSIAAGALTLASAPGNGTCAYRIERAPKVYDPSADTIEILTADEGQVPTGCPLICRHLGRIWLAGAEIAPHVWYASRQNDEEDWDYSQEDAQRAVAGTSSSVGVPGSPVTALAPHSDDYLIMGCRHSIWRMRGDPAYGAALDVLSDTVGIVSQDAWCIGPAGEMVFLSMDGIYILPPGGESKPISMSREVLPRELLNINPAIMTVLLEYDPQDRGVHIYLTEASTNSRLHWWFDWEGKRFWPITLDGDYEPTATCQLQATTIEDSGIILGGRDGMLRRFSRLSETDCGTAFTSYADIGPIGLAPDSSIGSIMWADAVLALRSGDVTWEICPSLTFEGAASAAAASSGTWIAGLNSRVHPAGRGQAFILRLTNSGGRAWAFEQAVIAIRGSGQRRIP